MPRGNPSPKLAITVDSEVHEGVVAAATAARHRATILTSGLEDMGRLARVSGREVGVVGV